MDGNPRIKICGITRREDAELSAELGAWALGFVFAEESPRRITLAQAKALQAGLPSRIERVGVFVDATLEEVRAAAEAGITFAQLHGLVAKEILATPPIPYIIARAPGNREQLEDLARFTAAEALLVDGYAPGVMGGTGVLADWNLAVSAKRFHPKVILAGGIKAENLRRAIATVRPYAVDVSSSLESSFGVKDPEKLRSFFAALPEAL